jgi:hypothetical protein
VVILLTMNSGGENLGEGRGVNAFPVLTGEPCRPKLA